MNRSAVLSLQDYSLVKTHVDSITTTFGLTNPAFGFLFFALDLILDLQDDEIQDAITDSAYLKKTGSGGGA